MLAGAGRLRSRPPSRAGFAFGESEASLALRWRDTRQATRVFVTGTSVRARLPTGVTTLNKRGVRGASPRAGKGRQGRSPDLPTSAAKPLPSRRLTL